MYTSAGAYSRQTEPRLPDVRPYLYYAGYWGHWEVEGAEMPPALRLMNRAQVEDYYVCLGRMYLRAARQSKVG